MTAEPACCYRNPMRDTSDWKGQLRLESYYARWSGSVGDAVLHRHFAAQAIFSEEPIAAVDAEGRQIEGQCLLIEPDAAHRLLPARDADLWFIEPTVAFGPPDELRARLKGAEPIVVGRHDQSTFWERWLKKGAKGAIDPRIAGAMASIDQRMKEGPVQLADAAQVSGLSLGRFRHLFASEFGMPFQRYVLWRRLIIAFDSLQGQDNVTAAAHAAGFADSAHFARTIKAMFGIRASDLLFAP
ncbi:MAG: helix-turn-helix domain-containing protein [Sphingomonadales bacterium]|nr:helix-turn-helix domain-containing protein [Sphingomonadales bacterium]